MTTASTNLACTHSEDRVSNRDGWRRLLLTGAAMVVFGTVVAQVAGRFVGPSFVVIALAMLVGAALLLRRPGKAGVVVLGIFCLLNCVHAPLFWQVMSVPTAYLFFTGTLATLLGTVTGMASAVGALRSPLGLSHRRATRVTLVLAVAVALAAVASVTSYLTRSSDVVTDSDVPLTRSLSGFAPHEVIARSGRVTLAVTNDDPFAPAIFEVDGLGTKTRIGPKTTRLVTFTAKPGSYRFHDDGTMTSGRLLVR